MKRKHDYPRYIALSSSNTITFLLISEYWPAH